MPPPDPLFLLRALKDPAAAARLDLAGWDLLLRQLRRTRLHPRLSVQLREAGLVDALPEQVRPHVAAGCVVAASQERTVRWEVDRIARALEGFDGDVVLLKGAAYVVAGLPLARGRFTSDVDILVEKGRLGEVERALLAHGWEPVKIDDYDQMYYRRWMHELPPMRHPEREAVVDVHHTILPETARLKPDAAELLRGAVPLAGRLKVLCPADLFLHSATHLFCEEMANPLRDLVDLADLAAHYGRTPSFWGDLEERARRLDLPRPLFSAVRYTGRLLDAPGGAAPGPKTLAWMDRLAGEAFSPEDPCRPRASAARARFLLYMRAHALRMPPLLLARHLLTKSFKRLFHREPAREAER